MDDYQITTRLLHTPFPKKDPHGSLNFPVYDSVAFEAESAQELEKAFTGDEHRHMYSRITNPTVEYFETKIRHLTEAASVTALSSGMAAVSNLMLAIGRSGDNIITTKHLFGNTLSLFEKILKPFGLEFRYTDMTDPARVESLVDDHTIAIFLETISNPQLEVASISELSSLAAKYDLLLIADTTLTPPSVFTAQNHGVHIEVMSSTKYISGGATSVGGLVIDYGTYDWEVYEKTREIFREFGPGTFDVLFRKQVFRNMGACLSPHNAYLQSLGLDTLALRSARSTTSALEIARWMESHPAIRRVNYPGLTSSPNYQTTLEQFGDRPCSLLTFDLETREACYAFMNRLKIIRRSTNLQDNKTLVIHPYSTIFSDYPPDQKEKMGIRNSMMRLSVGIEEPEDLMKDLEQALDHG